MMYHVELSCYVPGSGFSYTTELDPIIYSSCSEKELAREYAEEFMISEEQSNDYDFLFEVYNEDHRLVSSAWSFELYDKEN